MAWGDYYSTTHTRNIAESAHAHLERDGTRLTSKYLFKYRKWVEDAMNATFYLLRKDSAEQK